MNIYQDFRKEEYSFVDQVLQWKSDVSVNYTQKLSDFLDPREQQITTSIIGNDVEVCLSFSGGNSSNLERKRALIYPAFFELNESDFQISTFEILYPSKFVNIEHREVLGSLMGIGIKREKFGDILIKDGQIQIVIASEVADYVKYNLVAIGRTNVKLNQIPNSEQIMIKEEWEEDSVTVSSLRLDAVLSEIYRTSRSKIVPYIEKGLVKVNWKIIEHPSFLIRDKDYLSVRGYGRSKVLELDGKTKRDKWRLIIGRKK